VAKKRKKIVRELPIYGSDVRSSGPGFCIYCYATNDLTDEHVIPLALAGNLILEEASCSDCGRLTSQVEGALLREGGAFFGYRERKGYPTRSIRESETVPIDRYIIEEGKPIIEPGSINRKDYPRVLALPMFRLPGCLLGMPPSRTSSIVSTFVSYNDDDLLRVGDFATPPLDIYVFSRFLAKIAHCFSYFDLGKDEAGTYRQYLPPVILGKDAHTPYVVGGESKIEEQDSHAMIHLRMQPVLRVGLEFMTCRIRLFNNAPTYIVVFGCRKERSKDYYYDWYDERKARYKENYSEILSAGSKRVQPKARPPKGRFFRRIERST
jgi:hypothetical protein